MDENQSADAGPRSFIRQEVVKGPENQIVEATKGGPDAWRI